MRASLPVQGYGPLVDTIAVARACSLMALGAFVVVRAASCGACVRIAPDRADAAWRLGLLVALMHVPALLLAKFVAARGAGAAASARLQRDGEAAPALDGEISALRTEPEAMPLRMQRGGAAETTPTALPDGTSLFAPNPESWGEHAAGLWETIYAWLVDAPVVTRRYAAVDQSRHPCVPAVEQRAVQVMPVHAADLYEEGFAFADTCEALRDEVRSLRRELRVFSKPLTALYLVSLQDDMLAASKRPELVRAFFDDLRSAGQVPTLATVAAVGKEPRRREWAAEWKAVADGIEHQSLGVQECTADRLHALAPGPFERLHAVLRRPSGGRHLQLRARPSAPGQRAILPRKLWVLAVPREGVIVRFTWPKAHGGSTLPHIDSNLFGVPLIQRGTLLAPWIFGRHSPLLLLNFWLPWHDADTEGGGIHEPAPVPAGDGV